MYLRLCLFSNSDGLFCQMFRARSFGQILGFPQSLHVNLGFVGLFKISTRLCEIYYSIIYLSFYPT